MKTKDNLKKRINKKANKRVHNYSKSEVKEQAELAFSE